MLGLAGAAAGAVAGMTALALPVLVHLPPALWPGVGAGATLLGATGYLVHHRAVAVAVSRAVERARLDLVDELDEIGERALALAAAEVARITESVGAGADDVAVGDVAVGDMTVGDVAVGDVAVGDMTVGDVAVGDVAAGPGVAAGAGGATGTASAAGCFEAGPARPAAAAVATADRPAADPAPAGPGVVAGLPRPRSVTGAETLPPSRVQLERAVARLVAGARGVPGRTEAPPNVLVELGRDGRVSGMSETSARVLGWKAGDLLGQPFAGLVHVADLPTFSGMLDGALAPVVVPGRTHLVRVRTGDGSWRTVEWRGRPADDPACVALAGLDVTDRLRLEADFLHQATHDPLTGLPNRAALLRLAAEAVAAAGRDNPLSVLVIDLDRFKDVNDSLGHVVGDHLLAKVGPRLRAALRPTDTIARLGGDEFAVLLPTSGEDGARMVADRLAEALDSPFEVDGIQLHVEASIGIAVSHREDRIETTMVEGLLREADIAMYRAKDEGSVIVQFDPEKDAGQGRSRLELSAQLRRAIAESELVLYYQPTVDVFEGRLAGVEALVRWNHPERGLLPPGIFLPLAESTGLIVPLSRLVLATAVAQAAEWNRSGHQVQIAVNLSPRWLQHSDIPQIVSDLLERHDVPPELLRLEITESVVLAQPEHALGQLQQLRKMGVGLSLDDFGTGYSSMTHLRNLPVDELKVDRGFVHAMTSSPQDAVIVRSAIELGHNLGMDVVAEGIEDADTLAEIVASGCCLAQGFYFSMALPARELIAWAAERFPDFGKPGGPAATRRPRD